MTFDYQIFKLACVLFFGEIIFNLLNYLFCYFFKVKIDKIIILGNPFFSIYKTKIRNINYTLGWTPFAGSGISLLKKNKQVKIFNVLHHCIPYFVYFCIVLIMIYIGKGFLNKEILQLFLTDIKGVWNELFLFKGQYLFPQNSSLLYLFSILIFTLFIISIPLKLGSTVVKNKTIRYSAIIFGGLISLYALLYIIPLFFYRIFSLIDFIQLAIYLFIFGLIHFIIMIVVVKITKIGLSDSDILEASEEKEKNQSKDSKQGIYDQFS